MSSDGYVPLEVTFSWLEIVKYFSQFLFCSFHLHFFPLRWFLQTVSNRNYSFLFLWFLYSIRLFVLSDYAWCTQWGGYFFSFLLIWPVFDNMSRCYYYEEKLTFMFITTGKRARMICWFSCALFFPFWFFNFLFPLRRSIVNQQSLCGVLLVNIQRTNWIKNKTCQAMISLKQM